MPLVASLPERNLQRATNFLLACQGFSINLRTVRPVFVAGETFEVSVETRDAENKPAGRELTLKVFERTAVQGKIGERLIQTHEFESDTQHGTGRVTLRLDSGGKYLVRVEGIDRFENAISSQLPIPRRRRASSSHKP